MSQNISQKISKNISQKISLISTVSLKRFTELYKTMKLQCEILLFSFCCPLYHAVHFCGMFMLLLFVAKVISKYLLYAWFYIVQQLNEIQKGTRDDKWFCYLITLQ